MHYSDAEVKDLVARGTPVVKGLSSDDDDLYDEGQDHLKVLTEFAELDGDTLPNTPKTERWRSQRDESAAWLEALIEQAPGPESQFGPVVRTREYTDERGRYTKDFFDSEGNLVDRQQLSRAETDEKAADIKAIVDTRENVRWIREQAQNKPALANDADRTGSANVAATLREEADALDAAADSKMVSLR